MARKTITNTETSATPPQEAPAVRSRTQHSDDEKRAGLETINLCGGNVAEAARLTGIEESTLRTWARGHCVAPAIFAEFAERKQGAVAAKLRALLDRLADELASDERIASARYGELNAAFGTIFDKLRLGDGQPTQITERRLDEATRAKALALLDEYADLLGDRDKARAALIEDAPALSVYVN